MAKAGGKGKISNDLVAASCAAVLAVYAAGYWRTRDEARRIDRLVQERRPARSHAASGGSWPTAAETALPTTPSPEPTPATTLPQAVAAPPQATAAKEPPAKASGQAVTAVLPQASASPQVASIAPADTSVAVSAAPAAIEPEAAAPSKIDSAAAPSGNWRDGTYTGWGTSRHGDIKAQVVIKDGRIVESSIASCETRYPCDVISTIVHQPVERQNPDVDRVSRATESADAYYYGLVDALSQALVQSADQPATSR